MDRASRLRIESALLRDRYRLRRQWKQIQANESGGKSIDPAAARFRRQLDASVQAVAERRQSLPLIDFDQDLPILNHRDEIVSALDEHQVVVVCGETGSGKSTQLPKICLSAGYGIAGMIGHTQPRRIAARSIANRLADELRRPLGQAVGFKIRFTDKTSPKTYIKLMTDGILLAETQHDRHLEHYEVIIIDEAHERSLNIDFLLGYLKRLLPQRPELRVIVTSATIDANRFGRHFATYDEPAPVIEIGGRTYPVDVLYRPLESTSDDKTEVDVNAGLVAAVHELFDNGPGHILIFLPTERDIREAAKRLRAEKFADGSKTEILPLYARLSTAEQNRVFQSVPHRRIVLATNVAESSLTVPDIRYVIDTGTARISRYSPRSKVQRLPIEPVSRASADQRSGRCGRVGPGIAVRLYSRDDLHGRPAYTAPEIQRTNLASVILQSMALKLGRVEDFPFLDPPRPETIRDGHKTLFEIGAIDERKSITEIGRMLTRLPVDPRIGRIIVAGHQEGCLNEILIIAAALEVRDPRDRPHDKKMLADEKHEPFADEQSDFISYLKLWDFYHGLRKRLSHSKVRRACQQNFLSFNRLREWGEVHRQLEQLARQNGFRVQARRDQYDNIHRALLCGFLWGLGYRSGDHEYTGAGGIKFHVWPGSGLFSTKPKWCVTAERIETTRCYGRTVARIDPKWIESIAAHLVKRHYSDPHFHQKSGRVMAYESVTLFGLPIVQRRRVPYGSINPDASREIFIRDGLAARQLNISDKFYTHNESIIDHVSRLAAHTRNANHLIDEYVLERFYETHLPTDVVDIDSLRRWIKNRQPGQSDLRLTIDDLLPTTDATVDASQFPRQLEIGGMRLPVDYHFAPGEDDDGVTITVPAEGLGQLQPAQLGWLVPGLLEEKIVALIRSLPKAIRRNVIPAPDTARQIAAEISFGDGDFFEVVRERLSQIAGEPIPSDAFRTEKIPAHLRLNVRLVDQNGKCQAEGRDIRQLRQDAGVTDQSEIPSADHSQWHRDAITDWDFGTLPDEIAVDRGGIEVPGFPALIDHLDESRSQSSEANSGGAPATVSLRLLGSKHQALVKTRAGVRRLYVLKNKKALRSQVNWLPDIDKASLYTAGVLDKSAIRRDATELIADRAFFGSNEGVPRDETSFRKRLDDATERIGGATQEVAKLLPKLFASYHQAKLAIERSNARHVAYAIDDMRQQMSRLMSDRFLVITPWQWLTHYPRYLQAIVYRADRLTGGSLDRDRKATSEIQDYWQRFEADSDADAGDWDPNERTQFRWMLEEYRVSCFAQPLGTSFSISAKRLDRQWEKVLKRGR